MKKSKISLYLSITIITLLSFWIRLSYFENTIFDNPVRGDAAQYIKYANNLVNYHTFSKQWGTSEPSPDSYWAPGYPTFLAAAISIAKITGFDAYTLIIYAQVIMGTLIAVTTLLLGRLFLTPSWALLAATLTSLSPHLVTIGGYLLTETLFTLLLLLAIYCFSLAYLSKSTKVFTLAGLFFSLSYLVNPVVFFTPILLVLAAIYFPGMRKTGDKKIIYIPGLIILFTVAGAWSIRGEVNVPEGSISSSNRLLTNLVIGSHSNYHEIWRNNPRDQNNPAGVDIKNINGSFSAFGNLFAERFAAAPSHYISWYLSEKPIFLWDWEILTGQGDIYVYPVKISWYHTSKIAIASYAIMKSLHFWLFAFAIVGILLWRKNSQGRDNLPVFIYITTIYISAIYVVTQSEARYSIPLRPEMYLCAVFFMSRVFTLYKKYKVNRVTA